MTRNEVIDEVLEAIKGLNGHNNPLPDSLRPAIEACLQEFGIEQMIRNGGEAMKTLVLDTVAELKN